MTKSELDFHMALTSGSKGAARDLKYLRRAHFRKERTRTVWSMGMGVLCAIFLLQLGSSFARGVSAEPNALQKGFDPLPLLTAPVPVGVSVLENELIAVNSALGSQKSDHQPR